LSGINTKGSQTKRNNIVQKKNCSILFSALAATFLAAAMVRADSVAVIVGFHGQADETIFERHGGKKGTPLGSLHAHAGHVPASQLKGLRAEPGVAYVEEDLVRQPTFTPNDTYYASYQADDFGLIGCPAAWDVSKGAGKRVSVLDTGCQLSHPDIGSGSSGKVKAWKNFTTSGASTDVKDNNGHGTHTAGTVGAKTNNSSGVASAGVNCELAIGKVLGSSGGYDSWVAAGINWSWQTAGAKVVSMSLGGPGATTTLQNAVNSAWANGVVVVAAAGNDGSTVLSYPGAYTNCISVAATTNAGALASFSNYGSTVDIAAPGVNIASTYKGSGYALMSGTSMATPHVAGVAALVWASPFGTSNAAVRKQLQGTATRAVTTPNGSPLKLVDAYAAVTVAAP